MVTFWSFTLNFDIDLFTMCVLVLDRASGNPTVEAPHVEFDAAFSERPIRRGGD
jgi:hypothetical protein